MLRKDKRLLFFLCVITAGLISFIVTTFTIEVKYGRYARSAAKYSEEARDAMQQLDSTMISN